jgi:hypothetical protein
MYRFSESPVDFRAMIRPLIIVVFFPGLSLHPFALSLSKGIHWKKLGFDRLTPNGF